MASIPVEWIVLIYLVGVVVLAGVFGLALSKYLPKSESRYYDAFNYAAMAILGLVALTLIIGYLLSNSNPEIVNIATIASLIFALLVIASDIYERLEGCQNRIKLGASISTIQEDTQSLASQVRSLEETLNNLNPQNQPPEGSNRRIIPLELHDDSDTKTITTQYESDGVTVTSTLKITIRKE